MKNKNYISSQYLIQLTIGLYFFISGLLGIIGYNSGANQLLNNVNKLMGKSSYLPLIISICFLISGSILVIGLFLSLKNSAIYYVVLVLWIVYTIFSLFTDNFLKPELLIWIKELTLSLVILSGLLSSVMRKR